jgi:hypothetical protein
MKTVRLLAVATVFTFGLSAFVPASYGCGGMSGSGCKTVSAPPLMLAIVRAVVDAFEVIAP